jgi:hypothetical protein
MATHMASVLSKCRLEDIEFLAILQVGVLLLLFGEPTDPVYFGRLTLLEYCVFAAIKTRGCYFLHVAFQRLLHAPSVTLSTSRLSAYSCHRF